MVMPALKRISISISRRGRRGKGRNGQKIPARHASEVREEDILRLEIETLYMIGAPAS